MLIITNNNNNNNNKVGCMAWEARYYHQNNTIAENSLVRHSKDSKKAVGKLKEKK